MDRYIIIDLKEKTLITINDITMNDELDGTSVLCRDNNDLMQESRELLDSTEKMLASGKYF